MLTGSRLLGRAVTHSLPVQASGDYLTWRGLRSWKDCGDYRYSDGTGDLRARSDQSGYSSRRSNLSGQTK
ncbi:hypothetical protein RRG08_023367 [Elysia crispata]|uniref:Uncharacterized protein n=1 Tax=Elysia crispata TaxID=231223 RepID=A0AAE1BED7_9GAST|nr:hypothetical protein RRG08_023367 [Elysia crispata]